MSDHVLETLPQTLKANSPELNAVITTVAHRITVAANHHDDLLVNLFVMTTKSLSLSVPRQSDGERFFDSSDAWLWVGDRFEEALATAKRAASFEAPIGDTVIEAAVRATFDRVWPLDHPGLVMNSWMRGQMITTKNAFRYEATGHTCSDCQQPLVFDQFDMGRCVSHCPNQVQ